MARRLRVVIQSHVGREGPVFTTALTLDVFTISAGFPLEDSLATLIPVGSSANRNEREINSSSSVIRPRALSLHRSSSKAPATDGDNFHLATFGLRRSPCASRCSDRSVHGRARRLDF